MKPRKNSNIDWIVKTAYLFDSISTVVICVSTDVTTFHEFVVFPTGLYVFYLLLW